MKKILFMVVGILLVIGLVAGGTIAYFSDTETSTGNVFQAGTIDLSLNDSNPCSVTIFEFIEVKPCEVLLPFEFTLTNVGQNPGILYTSMSYVELDKFPELEPAVEVFEFTSLGNAAMELSADQFAAIVYVSAVTYQYWWPEDPDLQPGGYIGSVHDDLGSWMAMDLNSDGKLSLYEIAYIGYLPYDVADVPFPASAIITYTITFHLADSLVNWDNVTSAIVTGVEDNRPQADGIAVTVNGYLYQVGHGPPVGP